MMMIAIMAITIGVINKASRSALSSDIDTRAINCYNVTVSVTITSKSELT